MWSSRSSVSLSVVVSVELNTSFHTRAGSGLVLRRFWGRDGWAETSRPIYMIVSITSITVDQIPNCTANLTVSWTDSSMSLLSGCAGRRLPCNTMRNWTIMVGMVADLSDATFWSLNCLISMRRNRVEEGTLDDEVNVQYNWKVVLSGGCCCCTASEFLHKELQYTVLFGCDMCTLAFNVGHTLREIKFEWPLDPFFVDRSYASLEKFNGTNLKPNRDINTEVLLWE